MVLGCGVGRGRKQCSSTGIWERAVESSVMEAKVLVRYLNGSLGLDPFVGSMGGDIAFITPVEAAETIEV